MVERESAAATEVGVRAIGRLRVAHFVVRHEDTYCNCSMGVKYTRSGAYSNAEGRLPKALSARVTELAPLGRRSAVARFRVDNQPSCGIRLVRFD
jgi:hypothetical protein